MAYVNIDGGANPFVPNMSSLTGDIQVMISRKQSSFSTEQYCRKVLVEQPTGHYLKIDTFEQVRMIGGAADEWVWPLGNPAPEGHNIPFDLTPTYSCVRYAPHWYIPLETSQRAVWDVMSQHAQQRVVTAMTIRARKAATALAADASWTESGTKYANIADLGTAGGISITGNYAASSGNIQKFFAAAANVIKFNSAGAVNPKTDIIAIMNPTTASLLAVTTEFRSYITTTPYAPGYLEGTLYPNWMLPASLFNVANIVLEDAVQVTSARGAASTTKSYIFPDGIVCFVSRPQGLTENAGSNFATVTEFLCSPNNLAVETWLEPVNRRYVGRVIDEIDVQVTAPLTGVYVNITA